VFVIANFLQALAVILHYVLILYMWVIIARAVLSWVSPDPYNPIVRFVYLLTEPVLYRVRSLVPLPMAGLDLSPLIVLVIIIFLDTFLVKTLHEIAVRLH
jgi:YggT family protein